MAQETLTLSAGYPARWQTYSDWKWSSGPTTSAGWMCRLHAVWIHLGMIWASLLSVPRFATSGAIPGRHGHAPTLRRRDMRRLRLDRGRAIGSAGSTTSTGSQARQDTPAAGASNWRSRVKRALWLLVPLLTMSIPNAPLSASCVTTAPAQELNPPLLGLTLACAVRLKLDKPPTTNVSSGSPSKVDPLSPALPPGAVGLTPTPP